MYCASTEILPVNRLSALKKRSLSGSDLADAILVQFIYRADYFY